jgi:hypothetical protein
MKAAPLPVLIFLWLSTSVLASEQAPWLQFSASDRIVTLKWSSILGASGYKVYYKNFPAIQNQSFNEVSVGKKNEVVAELSYGQRLEVAVAAIFESGETELSSSKVIQIQAPNGEYVENVAEPIGYAPTSVYSYTGLPSYIFKDSSGRAYLFKQFVSIACLQSANCGQPTVSRVYEYHIEKKKFTDVTDNIFTSGDTYTIPPMREAVVADFNNDGYEDIAFANSSEGPESYEIDKTLAFDTGWKTQNFFILSDGKGSYRIAPLHPHVDYAHSIDAADIDNDGDVDLYIGSKSPHDENSVWSSFDQAGGYFLINDGRGGFTRSLQRLKFSDATKFVDLDNDGTDEIVNGIHITGCHWGVCAADYGLGIYKQSAIGSFEQIGDLISPLPYPVTVTTDSSAITVLDDGTKVNLNTINDIQNIDVNNDGLEDLIVLSIGTEQVPEGFNSVSHNFYTILINKGNLVFELSTDRIELSKTDYNHLFLEVIDMDGDDYKDIVFRAVGGGHLADKISNEVYYNDGKGHFSNVNKLGLPNMSGIFDFADIDNDGDMDVVTTTGWDTAASTPDFVSFITNLWINEGEP